MKTAFVCAIILSQFAAEGRDLPSAKVIRCVPTAGIVPPAPVAELTRNNGATIEGVFLRVATAPKPLNMINPLAPPEYGSARSLVVTTDDRASNLHKGPIHPDGIRLLTFRPFW